MHKAHLILTVDYELFGNGSGCLDSCVIKPAESMMQIAESFKAPITFFVEALEFISFATHLNDNRACKQLKHALIRGHDLQLHIHPQWDKAYYDAENGWQLNLSMWRLGDLSQSSIVSLVSECKEWLESEIASNISGYQCIAFRAGAWCIQPSRHIITTLVDKGILVDSSVAPGQWRPGRDDWADFRLTPNMPFWKTADDVCKSMDCGIWEVPITSTKINRIQHLKSLYASRRFSDYGLAFGCSGSYRSTASRGWNNFRTSVARLNQLGKVMLDFSTLSSKLLIQLTNEWLKKHSSYSKVPIVAIAHTKNFTERSKIAFKEYLEWAFEQKDICFSTFNFWLDEYKENE